MRHSLHFGLYVRRRSTDIRLPVPVCRRCLPWSFAYAPLSLTFSLPQLSLEALLRGRAVGDSAECSEASMPSLRGVLVGPGFACIAFATLFEVLDVIPFHVHRWRMMCTCS